MFCYQMTSECNDDAVLVWAVCGRPGPVRGRLAGGGGVGLRRIGRPGGPGELADGRGSDRGGLPVAGLLVLRLASAAAGRRRPRGPVPAGLAAGGAAEPAG